MLVAILIGIVVGIAGFCPLVFGMNKARLATPTSNLGHAGALLLGVLLSTVLLAGAVIICVVAFRDFAAPFAGGAAAGLIAAAAAFGISKNLRK